MSRRTPLPAGRAGRRTLAATGLAATCLLAACAPVQQAEAPAEETTGQSVGEPADAGAVQQGGELVVALSAEPDRLDPVTSRSLYSRYVFHTMCEKLYDLDADAEIVPQLATALPEVSDDGRTVTIPVREGVVFADGTPFDAAAVKTTLERSLSAETSARRGELGPITSVEAPDPTTVVITLAEPFAPLTAALADRAGMILSPTALSELGEEFATAPVCVGPFKFVNRVAQNSIEVERDPNYYDADRVFLDRITYRIITDASIRAANLQSGDAQVADTLSTQDVPGLRDTEGITVLETDSLGYQGVTFNVGNVDGLGTPPGDVGTPVANDPRVRQAFEYSVDREGLVQAVWNGLYSPACSPISPESEFSSDAAQECTEFDPARSRELLQEAGVQQPYPLSMIVSNNPDTLRLAQALQANVEEGGFALSIEPVEYSSLLDQQDRGDFESLQLGWSGRVDPDANITNFLGTGGGQNVAGYSNPELDTVLEQARTSTDTQERVRLYGEAVGLIQADDPIVYLYRQRNLSGVTDDVQGVQVFPDGVLRVAFAGLTG